MIYIVEDDESIRKLIEYALKEKDYEVEGFSDGLEVNQKIIDNKPDLVLLDVMLPGKNGFEILKDIRRNNFTKDIAVIMLTAKSTEYDKLTGFENGADDYITKPFSVLELLSRVKALLRRTSKSKEEILKFKEITLDEKKRKVVVSSEEINLTYKEFEMLKYFMQNIENVITRENFLYRIWGYDYEGETRTVDVHIASLRSKLKDSGKYIQTIRNLGYRFGDLND
ncbi:MAG: response regulator transcription factor [Peptoniphilaceae bacterium]|nr:response regulator transcription factor [Peptoniphilaceae bacterium]MDD7383426.1 response regulator transcription factor [Peptoniphilaceae bacterium]MDY3738821.1 response regulator transcription factor [Peptoniphilaceae bacterium]